MSCQRADTDRAKRRVRWAPRRRLRARRPPRAARVGTLVAVVAIMGLLAGPGAWAAPDPTSTQTPSAPSAQSAASADVTWGVAPANNALGKNRAHFTYTLAPGKRVDDALTVVNRSTSAITLTVYASDAFTTPNGAIDLLPAGQRPVDVGSWIALEETTVTLQPQESTAVPFTLTVPANATPGDHSGGVVTSLVAKGTATGVSVDRRLGSRVYLRVPGELKPALTVGTVDASYHGGVNPGAGGSAEVTYTVTNTGNVRLQAHQSVRVAGPFGALSRTATLTDLPELLPGNSLTVVATVRGVWPATRMTAQVDLAPMLAQGQSTAPEVSASTTVWAWPWGQLIVLIVIVGLLGGYLWLRRRRQRSVQAAIADAVAHATGSA